MLRSRVFWVVSGIGVVAVILGVLDPRNAPFLVAFGVTFLSLVMWMPWTFRAKSFGMTPRHIEWNDESLTVISSVAQTTFPWAAVGWVWRKHGLTAPWLPGKARLRVIAVVPDSAFQSAEDLDDFVAHAEAGARADSPV